MTVGDKTYEFLQFHFHAPSEHTVDGAHYPMEVHFVHQAGDGELAVLGVLVEEGAEHPGLAPSWAEDASGTETAVRIPPTLGALALSGQPAGLFHYEGSLTTPPCSEGVQWYVRTTPTEFSRDQITAFTAIYDHNNRPVQELSERALYLDARTGGEAP